MIVSLWSSAAELTFYPAGNAARRVGPRAR
jgi:hypothetical protein